MIGIQRELSTKLKPLVDKLTSFFNQIIARSFQDLWLQRCALCESKAELTPCLCQACKADLEFQGITCVRCYEPLDIPDETLCAQCTLSPPSFDLTYCFALYRFPANRLIQYLKYDSQRYLARTMALCMAERLRETYGKVSDNRATAQAIALTYIPLDPDRLALRGFNQSRAIAEHLSKVMNLPMIENFLIKRHSTKTQVSLNRAQRLSNLRGTLRINEDIDLIPKHVILVDDVMTTGATAEAASKLLKDHGVARVDVCCFARTPKERDF
jgi:ComF family protein